MSRNRTEIRTKSDEILCLGSCQFDPVAGILRDDTEAEVNLRQQSREVLNRLAETPDTVVSKAALIEAVWGDTFVTDDSLVQCIGDIRRALNDHHRSLLVTVPRKGYRLVPVAAAQTGGPALQAKRSISVLPFTSMSDDPEHGHFADGLTEELVGRLAVVRGLTVFASPTRFRFKTRAQRVEEPHAELGADYLLDGSVRMAGARVRITARMIDAASDEVVFSRRYDRAWEDVLEVQDEIASQVIFETQLALTDGERILARGADTQNVEAWELFHRGVLAQLLYTPHGNRTARRLYERALVCDPSYLMAKAGVGWTYWYDVKSSHVADRAGAMVQCREIVDQLTEAQPDWPDTLFLDAVLMLIEGRHDEAVLQADAAWALEEPSRFYGRGIYGFVLLYAGDVERACKLHLEEIGRTPVPSDDTIHYYAHCLTLLGDHAQAIELAQEYRVRVPSTVYGFTLLATAQAFGGYAKDADETIAQMRAAHPTFTLQMFRDHEPYRDQAVLEKIIDCLREAGVPD